MRIGVLTSGGDCPGLNAVLRAIARKAEHVWGDQVIGFRDAWRGVLARDHQPLTIEACRGLLPRGGTMLGTSRVTPYQTEGGFELAQTVTRELGIDGYIVIGGNGSLACAHELTRDGIPCLGVPKTIDNDIRATELTFGFDTAVHIATEAIDRLHTTAEAHHRVLVVEVMGRDTGHIAIRSGMAGGAALILIPERPFDIDEVAHFVKHRFATHRYAPIVVVSEGALPKEGTLTVLGGEKDAFGHERLGGIGQLLERELEERTGHEARATVLGHVQRGGTPTAFDRWLATRFGLHAVDAVTDGDFGTMVALHGTDIVRVPIGDATRELKVVSPELYAEAEIFFG